MSEKNLATTHDHDHERDEIDLLDLIKNIWSQRGLIIGIMLIAVLGVLSFHFAKASFSTAQSIDYPISISFIKENSYSYPSGVAFSPRDLITNDVLQNTLVELGLELGVDKLGEAIDVKSSNSILKQAELKLSALLENAKTPDDIRLQAEENLHSLRELGRGYVTLTINLSDLNITPQQGSLLLETAVNEWAQLSIDRGLMNTDISRPLIPFAIKDGSNLIDNYDQAASYLRSLNTAVDELAELSGSGSLVVNNMSIEDLRRRLSALGDRDIGPLRGFAYSNSDTLSNSDLAIQVRLFARQRLLDLEHVRLVKLIGSYDLAVEQLGSNIKQQQYPGASEGSSQGSNQGSSAQFDKSFLDSLIQLGTKLSAVDTRKLLFDRRMEAVDQLLSLEKEISILKGASEDKVISINPVDILQGALVKIKDDLNEVQINVGQFVDAIREITLNSNSQVYIANSAPQVRGGLMQVAPRFAMFVVLSAILGLFLGVFVALIRSALLKSK